VFAAYAIPAKGLPPPKEILIDEWRNA